MPARPAFMSVLAIALGASSPAAAQQFPARDLSFVCAFPAGSGADVVVRYFAEKVKPLAGRTIIVENKPGASGNIGMELVARARPDGHTLYVHTGSSIAANMHLFKKPPVDAAKALQTVATINRQGFFVVVDPKSPFKTLPELTAFLKEKKAKATYATSNTSGKVIGELYKAIAGLEAVEVSYRMAADSLNDMASGAVDYGVHEPVFAMSQIREGRFRALAVATAQRLAAAPDVPTMQEGGVAGLDVTGWFAAFVPSATPKEVVTRLNGWFNEVLKTEETRKFLNTFGSDPHISTPEEGQAQLLRDIKAWGEYVRIARIEPAG